MSNGPEPPDSLPKYFSEGTLEQNDETLRELQSWIDELLEYRDRPLEEDVVVDSGEQLRQLRPLRELISLHYVRANERCRCDTACHPSTSSSLEENSVIL